MRRWTGEGTPYPWLEAEQWPTGRARRTPAWGPPAGAGVLGVAWPPSLGGAAILTCAGRQKVSTTDACDMCKAWQCNRRFGADVVGSFLISPVKGWASGHALLHAGIPSPDPSEADKASGLLVFRRWGFFGNAVGNIPAAAARCSAISHPGPYIKVILCGWSTTHFWLKEADEVLRNVKRT